MKYHNTFKKRKKQYGDSLGKIYEGNHPNSNKLILIDDIFTTGSSIIDSKKNFKRKEFWWTK